MALEEWQKEIIKKSDGKCTVSKLAGDVGAEYRAVRKYMEENNIPFKARPRPQRRYTDQHVLKVRKHLSAGGLTHSEIAKKLGVSRQFVSAVSSGFRKEQGRSERVGIYKDVEKKAAEAFVKVFGGEVCSLSQR